MNNSMPAYDEYGMPVNNSMPVYDEYGMPVNNGMAVGNGMPMNNGMSMNNSMSSYYVAEKNPMVGALLAFLFFGLGQIYNGQVIKGLICFQSVLMLGIMAGIADFIKDKFLFGTCCFLCVLFQIVLIVDAYKTACRINMGQDVGEFKFWWVD